MQLYKSRGFSEFFQDTFAFLKQNGKHFFKHYLIVNGIFLIIMMVFMYFFTKFYTSILFGAMTGNPGFADEYINENLGLFILMFVVFFIIALIAGVISFAFVPLYLKLYAERGHANFEIPDLVKAYKANIGKLLTFLVCGFLLGIPLVLALGIGAFILAVTIVGILLLPFLIAGFSLFYGMSLMEYVEEKRGIWESFGYAWNLLSSKFWPSIGSVGIFLLMAYVVQGLLSMIPYIFGMASLFSSFEGGVASPQDVSTTMTIVMIAMFFLNFLVGALVGVVVQLNQGVVFYSLKEDSENINTKSVIDQIGSGE